MALPAIVLAAGAALMPAPAAGGGEPPSEPALTAAPSPTLSAFHRGEELVRHALEGLGGGGALAEAGGLTVKGVGTRDLTVRLQGRHPERPEPVPVTEALAVVPSLQSGDGAGAAAEGATVAAGGFPWRVAYEAHARVNPDADEHVRYVYDTPGTPSETMVVALLHRPQAFRVPADAGARRYARRIPHLLLAEAWANRSTLRHLGRFDGEEAVTAHLPDPEGGTGTTFTLYFSTGEPPRLTGFAYLLDMPVSGDTTVRWRFGDHRPVEGLGPYPEGHRIEVGGKVYEEVRYREITPGEGAGLMRPPEGVSFPPPPGPPAEPPQAASPEPTGPATTNAEPDLPEVRTVAPGVHLALSVRGGFHALFVELGDSVVVVDAPAGYHELAMVPAIDWAGDVTSTSVGRRLLAAVRATVPDKPVSHLVLTHHHGDHAGGVRPFLAAGAKVVTGEASRPVVERAAGATLRLQPDELAAADGAPRVEVVEGRRVLTGGGRELHVIDVGPNPHAEDMLVVYLPEEKILYQSDLFFPAGGDAFPDPARLPVMRWFTGWLERSGLEVETVYSIHGSARVTPAQLETVRPDADDPGE